VTADDSGGTLEFVRADENGFIVSAEPSAVADAIARLDADRARARSLGAAGRTAAANISWDQVIDRLLSHG
jgi:glycosyltransferase involved in cell wall biosynthesis